MTKPCLLDTAAYSIKQIADVDGEPMIEVVVNSDCSAADINEAHAEALEMNITEKQAIPYLSQQEFAYMSADDKAMAISRDHTEALRMDIEYREAIQIVADNLTLPVWEGCSDIVKAEVVKCHHTEALEMNAEFSSFSVL